MVLIVLSVVAWSGCTSTKKSGPKPEKGPGGTIAYLIEVEASEEGVKIEANDDYIGEAPCTLKVFGDKDGTFHNFGRGTYTIRATPSRPGQYEQVKVFATGGWFSREDLIPKRIHFDMNMVPASAGGLGASAKPVVQAPPAGKATDMLANGTAFAITSDGYLISNFHVVQEAARIVVRFPDERVEAQVVEKDVRNDLVILKVFKQTKPLPLGDSASVRLGQELCTLGFPRPGVQGERVKFDKGTVSSLTGIHDDVAQFQISVPAQPGNSGGPIMNNQGEVVGVLVSGLNPLRTLTRDGSLPQNVNFAVKVSYLKLLLQTVPDLTGKLSTTTDQRPMDFPELAEAASSSVMLVETYR